MTQATKATPILSAEEVAQLAKSYAEFFARVEARPLILSGAPFALKKELALSSGKAIADVRQLRVLARSVFAPLTDAEGDPVRMAGPGSDLVSSFPVFHGVSASSPLARPDGAMPGIADGVVGLIGDSRSGKTTFLAQQAAVDYVVRISEPGEAIDNSERAVPVRSYLDAVACALVLSLAGKVVAIDSLRGLVYRVKGNTMEGGLSAGVFDFLTEVNNFFTEARTVVFITVNPMLGTAEGGGTEAVARRDAARQALNTKFMASISGVISFVKGPETLAYRRADGVNVSPSAVGEALATPVPELALTAKGEGFTPQPRERVSQNEAHLLNMDQAFSLQDKPDLSSFAGQRARFISETKNSLGPVDLSNL